MDPPSLQRATNELQGRRSTVTTMNAMMTNYSMSEHARPSVSRGLSKRMLKTNLILLFACSDIVSTGTDLPFLLDLNSYLTAPARQQHSLLWGSSPLSF